MSFYGGARVGARTMLDALFPAFEALHSGSLADAAAAAEVGALGTGNMGQASEGRSNYLNEDSLEGTPDPGAIAASIVLKAMAGTL